MKSVCIILVTVAICGCTRSNGGAQLERPNFQVDVKLTDKAESTIKTQNETVKVIACFFGQPDASVAAKILTDEHGQISMGRSEIELNGSGTADFSKIPFSPNHADLVGNADYDVLINVVSGRRSNEYNLLQCQAAGGKISAVKGKVLNVQCKLISGE